jgi:ABC-2 type transport system permease protein
MSTLIMFSAFIRRDFSVSRSYRIPFLIGLASAIFSLALFYYLGRIVDSSALAEKGGFEKGYFAFVLIGLSVLGIVQTGLTAFAAKLRQEQTTGTFEALVVTPAPPSVLVLGIATYDLLFATVGGFITMVFAAIVFGVNLDVGATSLAFGMAALVGCVTLFAALGVAVAAFTVVFKQGLGLVAMVASGLALLGGAYFPIDLLPTPLHEIGQVLPFTWALQVLRSALLDGEGDLGRLMLLLGSSVVLLPASLVLFNRALRRARQSGTLAQY